MHTRFLERTDFDTAICLTGYGKFHYELMLVCSISILAVGFQNGLSPYVFPAAQCELELTSFQLGLLNVCFLAGGTLSGFLWGILADTLGRRKVLLAAHSLNFLITVVCSVIPLTASLVVCRLINGFLTGAPGSILFSYFAEFQPPKYRSRSVCFCGLFFTTSWLLLPIFAYFALPLKIHYDLSGVLMITPWRLFMILVVIPEIIVAVWFLRMPESPKFYVANGNPREALMILRKMYSQNTGRSPEFFPVRNLIANIKIETNITQKIICTGKTTRILMKMVNQIKSLFLPRIVRTTALTCSVMFANMFGMFGLGLWLPDLFVRFHQYSVLHPNSTISVKELASLEAVKDISCEPSFDSTVIQSTVAIALSCIVYNALSSWISTKLDTRKISMISMTLGGLSAMSIYWMNSSLQNLVVACIFQATMITANITIACVGVELFPTNINGIAVCLILSAGRIGAGLSNIMFGYLMDKHCEIPIFVVAVIVLLGAGLCAIIPNNGTEDQELKVEGKKEIEIAVISSKMSNIVEYFNSEVQ